MNKTLTILVCIMVAGVVVGASLPIFDSLTASSESVHNEGAGWVRFALDKNVGTTYTLSYTEDENGFYIDNGTDRQTYDDSTTSDFETILYADSNLSVWHDGAIHILGTNEGNPVYFEGSGALTIVRDAEGVTLSSEGSDLATFGVPTWSYIPVSTGNYGFFFAADLDDELGNGVKNYPSDMPLAVVGGGNVGVYAYNDIYTYNGLGLHMHPVYDEEGLFYGAYWDKTAPVEPESLNPDVLDPAIIDLDPIDIDLDPLDPGVSLMSVPTPTYTEGDWGYDLTTIDGVQKAIIVSYSGTGGNITVPATVGGYDVYRFGKVAPNLNTNNAVMTNSSISNNTSLVISEGIIEIGSNALNGCTKITSLTLPDSLVSIGRSSISSTYITNLNIGPSLVNIYPDSIYSPTLANILVDSDNPAYTSIDGVLYSKDQTTLIFYPPLKSGDISIPVTTTTFSDKAFDHNQLTTPFIMPDTVTTIGNYCFFYSYFSSIELSPNLTSMGDYAFAYSKATNVLAIPPGVTNIPRSAFQNSKFSGLVIPNTIETISTLGAAFGSMSSTLTFVFAGEYLPNDNTLFGGMTSLTEVLDLSDTYDLNTDRHGIIATATVYDTIGDCFGFVSVVDVSGGGGSPTQTLIAMLPLIMVLGLVLMAVGIFIWNRM